MSRFELKDSDYSFNASLDPFLVLQRMGFTESSIYQEGNLVRIHCPIHKDLIRKSMIIDIEEKTFKCQYSQCDAYEGGLLIELVAMYYDCEIDEVTKNLFGEEDKSSDLLFRGEMYINKGMHQDALPYLEQAVQLDPHNETTRCKLAALYLELDRKDDSFREYMSAAESYAVRGELEKTLSIYNILIILQPGAVKARKELSYLFARMGRKDAAADQLKWVIDFYMQFGQVRGGLDAVNSMLELDPDNGMCYFLLAQMQKDTQQRVPAMQSYEKALSLLLEAGEARRARVVFDEAISFSPGNPRLKELRELLEKAEEEIGDEDPLSVEEEVHEIGDEQNLIDWLHEVEQKAAVGGDEQQAPAEGDLRHALARHPAEADRAPASPAAEQEAVPSRPATPAPEVPLPPQAAPAQEPPVASPPRVPTPPPVPREAAQSAVSPALPPSPAPAEEADPEGVGPETSEILPEDRRVALCMGDLQNLSPEQLERMRQQLIGMFSEVRKTYEDGLLSDWEMRTIKDFYKSFCVAVDLHRREESVSSPV